jgi:hypothetical protein
MSPPYGPRSVGATELLRVLIPAKAAQLSWPDAWLAVTDEFGHHRTFTPTAEDPGIGIVDNETMMRFLHRTLRAGYLGLPTARMQIASLRDEAPDDVYFVRRKGVRSVAA